VFHGVTVLIGENKLAWVMWLMLGEIQRGSVTETPRSVRVVVVAQVQPAYRLA